MTKFRERDIVRLITNNYTDADKGNVKVGAEGIIMAVYPDSSLENYNQYEVQFQDETDNNDYAILTVREDEIEIFNTRQWIDGSTDAENRLPEFPETPASDFYKPE